MSETIDATLYCVSQVFDDDLAGKELEHKLSEIEVDETLKQQWSRYSMIGHVIRHGGEVSLHPDLWLKVREQVESEPIYFDLSLNKTRSQKQWSQKFGAYALAASLLAISITVGRSFIQNSDRVFVTPVAAVTSSKTSMANAVAESRFDDYLLLHNESAQLAGIAGVMPYARIVSAKVADY